MAVHLEDISLDMIKVQKHNVRRRNIGEGIEDLAASIKANTLLQPIAAYLDAAKGMYVILTGQRRLQAYHHLNEKYPNQGYDKIKCMVFDEPKTDEEKMSMSLAENITQLQMTGPDLVKAVTDLYNKYGDYEIVREKFGITKYMVNKYVKLSRLPPELKEAIKNGEIHSNPKTAENSALRAVDGHQYTKGGPVLIEIVIETAKALAAGITDYVVPGVGVSPKRPKVKLDIDLSTETAEKLKRIADLNGQSEKGRATQYVVSGTDRDYRQLE